MTEEKTWVISWKPFRPAGVFIQHIDYSKSTPVQGTVELKEARRFTKAGAIFAMKALKDYLNISQLIIVDLNDHDLGEEK